MSALAPETTLPETTLFVRASKVQELYFYLFILLCVISLRRQIRGDTEP